MSTAPNTCTWIYTADPPGPGYWTVIDNCDTAGSCVGGALSGFTTSTAGGQKKHKAPHDAFKKAVKAKYEEAARKRSLTAEESAQLKRLDSPSDGNTFEMPCIA